MTTEELYNLIKNSGNSLAGTLKSEGLSAQSGMYLIDEKGMFFRPDGTLQEVSIWTGGDKVQIAGQWHTIAG